MATISSGPTSGGGVIPTPVAWFDIVGSPVATNNTQTLSGISAPTTLQVSGTHNKLYYDLNSAGLVKIAELGTITVNNGDTLSWGAGLGSGTVTVTNLSNSSVLATFNFDVEGTS